MISSKAIVAKFMRLPSIGQVIYRLPWYAGIICSAFLLIGEKRSHQIPLYPAGNWIENYQQSYVAASCLFYSTLLCTIFFAYKGTSPRNIPFVILPFISFNIWQWEMIPGFPFQALTVISIICFGIIFFGNKGKRDLPGLVLIMFFILMLSFYSYCFLDKVKGYELWPITG